MTSQKMTRRQALKLLGGAAAGATVASAIPAFAAPRRLSLLARLQTYQGKLTVYSTADPTRYEPLIKAAEEALPGVELDWRQLGDQRYVELFSAAELAGDQIDVMDMNGQDLRRYALAGKLLDLSDTPYLDRFRPVGLQTYTIGDKLWALPRGGIGGFTFLYNRKMLEKVGMTSAPETYDDLLALKPELEKIGASVFTHQGKDIYLWPVWQFWAHAQTSGNKAVENTIKTLQGEMKFTDPEHVAALEILYKFVQDGMFVKDVLGLDTAGAEQQWFQNKALFYYWGPWEIYNFRRAEPDLKDFDMWLTTPVRAVPDTNVMRQLPGGTGSALSIYSKIAPERLDTAKALLDFMTSDEWVEWANKDSGDAVSTNANVEASTDPIAIEFGKTCAPNQFVYLDWFWPPEITRSFQEQQQAIVAGTVKPDQAAASIQNVLEQLYMDGYEFI